MSAAFDGRVAMVTGAAGGIGRATASRLAAEGARVVAVDRDPERLRTTERELRALGSSPVAIVADLSTSLGCRIAMDAALEQCERLDVVVNNAAIGAFGLGIEDTTDEQWDAVLRINLSSVFWLSRQAVPALRRSGGGVIVNVSSIHAIATSPAVAPYAAAKGAVLALTRTMALDLAPYRIRAVCVVPGAVDTPMLHEHAARAGLTVEELGFPAGATDIGRVARPDEIAAVIVFAASDDASFVTGSALVADGGVLAKF
jgi:NAD(P)-dependent dehydrogenase (short-subunit alcohol dehydrogenase family)